MPDSLRFMNELFRIVNGALRLDLDRVRNYTAFLADKLEMAGETAASARLRKLLEESAHELRPATIGAARAVPVDSESRFPLVEKVKLRGHPEPEIILTDRQSSTIREFLSVVKSHAQLEAEGIATDVSLLLYGPPGCGKSRLARHIALELGLDLFVARLDGLVSSYLGSTSKNIRALFDFAARTPCVLFLDEFDAIAKLRGDSQELGELKRVVNSFIQNLDTVGKEAIIIAATNHEELLDAAIWRRFTYRLELSYPTKEVRKELWRSFSAGLDLSDRDLDVLLDLTEGFSGSDVHDACLRLRRKRIAEGTAPSLNEAFLTALSMTGGNGGDRQFLASLRNLSPRAIAVALRGRNPQIYTHSVLGDLFGVSKATGFRWTSEGGAVDG